MRLLSLLLALVPFAASAADLAVEVTNASEPVACAEKDNVTINLASSEVRRFRIEAVHPAYAGALRDDRFAPDFIRAADGSAGWEGQVWDDAITVPCLTLDRLIHDHGRPAFLKIDVEGFEDRVLMGLSRPVPALSFEFTTIGRDVAQSCLDRLAALGPYRFDVALGEAQRLTFGRWVSPDEMAAHLAALPHEANSGDVYAVLNA